MCVGTIKRVKKNCADGIPHELHSAGKFNAVYRKVRRCRPSEGALSSVRTIRLYYLATCGQLPLVSATRLATCTVGIA